MLIETVSPPTHFCIARFFLKRSRFHCCDGSTPTFSCSRSIPVGWPKPNCFMKPEMASIPISLPS